MVRAVRIDDLLGSCRTIVCVGSGGVGKTSVSAAIALAGARLGKRVLVLTIDPAKRLADAMGLEAFTDEEQEVGGDLLAAAGQRISGSLHAAMLDTKATFDRFIQRASPDEATATRILTNRYYHHAATNLAATGEYMAIEKLHEAKESDRFDLIVLDTPPTRETIDLLQAPERMLEFLDSTTLSLMRTLFKSRSRSFFSPFKASTMIRIGLGRFVGAEFLVSLFEFFEDLATVFDTLKTRTSLVAAHMKGDDIGFVVVTSPSPSQIEEALMFRERLVQGGFPFSQFIVNRVHDLGAHHDQLLAFVDGLEDEWVECGSVYASRDSLQRFLPRCRTILDSYRSLARMEQATIDRLAPFGAAQIIPEMAEDVHDLASLGALTDLLMLRPLAPDPCI